jgi:hypothetical protein
MHIQMQKSIRPMIERGKNAAARNIKEAIKQCSCTVLSSVNLSIELFTFCIECQGFLLA